MTIKTFIDTLMCTILTSLLVGCQTEPIGSTPNQHTQTNTAISKVWTAINEKFGGEDFNSDNWTKARQEFISKNYQTLDQEYLAIESLLMTLEEPSVRLLRTGEKEAFLNEISGQLPAGIGFIELLSVDIDERTNILTVITCFPQTAAAKAGLQSGDQIIKINGVPTEGLSLAQAMSKLRGAPGVKFSLDILRGNTSLVFSITSETARKISSPVRTFTQRYDDKTIGYIQYLIVSEGSAVDFQNGLSSLIRQGADAIVLDLRNNPGGSVTDGLAVADLFLEKGAPIVTLKAGQDRIVQKYYAENQAIWAGPTAILQNEGSASVAEFIAGALRANNRAIIVGQKSYGKGLLHTLTPLADGAAVMFHMGRLISPDNRDILHEMIIPDHLIPQTPSPIMSSDQSEVGTTADLQYQHALIQILKQE
jgi:carboxyl-terminal processing protease